MNRLVGLLFVFMLTACVFASDDIVLSDEMNHMTDDPSAPVVYFTRDISPEGLMKVYKAMRKRECNSFCGHSLLASQKKENNLQLR